jgi:hypothetical protein
MKATRLFYAILSLASVTGAISLHKRQDGLEPRVLALDLQRSTIHDPVGNDRKRLARRSGSVNVGIDNLVSFYKFYSNYTYTNYIKAISLLLQRLSGHPSSRLSPTPRHGEQ